MKKNIRKIILIIYKLILLILMISSIFLLIAEYNITNTEEYLKIFFITKTSALVIAYVSYKLFNKKIIIK